MGEARRKRMMAAGDAAEGGSSEEDTPRRCDAGWRDTRLQPSPCPYCDAPLDAATSPKGYEPSPGCFSVCINCAQLLVFRDDLSLRAATTAEIKEIEEAHPKFVAEITIMQRAVRSLDRREADEKILTEETRCAQLAHGWFDR
jgi:hypothetical protein